MKLFYAYILTSFLAIAVFGFMGLTDHNSLFSQCVNATIPGGMPCDGSYHNLGMDILHADMFQGFSNAILALVIALSAGLALVITLSYTSAQNFSFAQISIGNLNAADSASRLKLDSWLALHQQHPIRANLLR